MTLEWKVRSYRSENGRKIMSEDPQSLENHGFPQISQLVLHSIKSLEIARFQGFSFLTHVNHCFPPSHTLALIAAILCFTVQFLRDGQHNHSFSHMNPVREERNDRALRKRPVVLWLFTPAPCLSFVFRIGSCFFIKELYEKDLLIKVK